ncbi:hypothetical protein P4597_06045 [Peribacillus simplex]|uniref:hypothetical protein n=1 Tax=Peribacillus simplex TaxID=1478 RepID=UPI002E24F9AC|nr:hypothetical protein [Peribacillus simplex]
MKKIGVLFGVIVIIGIALYFILAQPKLEADLLGTGEDKKVILVTLENTGFRDIQLLDIHVNGTEKPDIVKLQVNKTGKGFTITDTFDDPGYEFMDYDSIAIEPEKVVNKNKEEIVSVYALTIKHSVEVHSLTVSYKYLGKEFEEIARID